jgi:hypothetical protein
MQHFYTVFFSYLDITTGTGSRRVPQYLDVKNLVSFYVAEKNPLPASYLSYHGMFV